MDRLLKTDNTDKLISTITMVGGSFQLRAEVRLQRRSGTYYNDEGGGGGGEGAYAREMTFLTISGCFIDIGGRLLQRYQLGFFN